MSRARLAVAVAGLAAALAGCSALAPFPTAPAAPGPGAHEAGPRVAICYNGLADGRARVAAAAQQECGPNTLAVPAGTDWLLQDCPVLLPQRANFVCTPKK